MGRMKELLMDEAIRSATSNMFPYNGAAPFQRHSETSEEAAKSIAHKINEKHRKILDWMKLHPAGATDERLCAELKMPGNTLRPRRRELELMGKVVNSGRTEPTQSGRKATVWVLP